MFFDLALGMTIRAGHLTHQRSWAILVGESMTRRIICFLSATAKLAYKDFKVCGGRLPPIGVPVL